MPKRTGKRLDVVQNARRVVEESVGGFQHNPALISQIMAEMGRKGGKIGGKRRMVTMTAEERSLSAQAAVRARWAKRKRKK